MFKSYSPDQIQLLPQDLEGQIKDDHLARIVSQGIDLLDLSELEARYSAIGQNAYNPRMLLKIIIYGYAIGLRSSRKLATACRENLVFMWLSGRQTPDFRTIALFRLNKLVDVKSVFVQVLNICQSLGLVRCGKVKLDGTKILAYANRHRVNYRKILKQREQKYLEQIEQIFREAEEMDEEENKLYDKLDEVHTGKKITANLIAKTVKKLQKKRIKTEAKKEDRKNKQRDNQQKLQALDQATKNSSALNDPDATVMSTKEQYYAPSYNAQLATENQIVVAYDVFEKCNDHHLLQPMYKQITANFGRKPELVVTDAGYGNKSNYYWLDSIRQKFVIPYQNWRNDKGKRSRGEYTTTNQDPKWEQKKWQIWNHLKQKKNRNILKNRGTDVEATIGDIKEHMGLRRFLYKTKPKVRNELGIAVIAHNFKKIRTGLITIQQTITRALLCLLPNLANS